VVLNFYFVSIGTDQATIGWLQGMSRIGGLLTSVPVGLIAARYGAQRVMILATVGIAVVYGLYVAFPTLAMLTLARFLLGVFYGAQQIAMVPYMIALVRPDQQTRFFAYQNLVAMAGMALGGIVGGFLPAWIVAAAALIVPAAAAGGAQSPFAYGSTLLLCGAITLASVIPFFWLRGRAPAGAGPRKRAAGEQRVRIRWGLLILLTLPMIPFGFTGGLTFPFYNLFFRDVFIQPDAAVGIILSLGWIGMALTPLANPFWERRFGRPWSIFLVMAIASVAFVTLGAAGALIVGALAYIVAVSFRNVMQPLFQPLLMDSLPSDQHAMASSMSNVLWNLGWFSATAISGTWQATQGYGFIMSIVAIGVLVCGASVVLIFRRRPAARANPALAA
jgi:predicted MFS family arabinose efflux permease